MKTMRVVVSLTIFLLFASMIHGQDLSKYRNISFGMSLAEVSKQVDSQPLRTKLIREYPAAVQEVTWWPRDSSGSSLQREPVWQVLFTFYDGELCRILVTYDQQAVKGLTIEDMVEAISTQYGTPTRPTSSISFPTNELYSSTEIVIARWEDSEYSINLFRSSFLNTFGLVMFSKRLDAQARIALVASVKAEDPRIEIDRLKKEADKLEVSRQKNKKAFRP